MTVPPESRPPEEPGRLRSPAPPGSAEDALRRLEERLDRASEAAERLMAQAAAEAAAGLRGGGAAAAGEPPGNPEPAGGDTDAEDRPTPPPAGWQVPEDAGASGELDPFVSLVQALRDLIPPELQRRLVAALRELLLALRAVIDWYLERLERRREQAVDVQDIPIL
jgi:hypothetical protein